MYFGVEVECFVPGPSLIHNASCADPPIVAELHRWMQRMPAASGNTGGIPTAVSYYTYRNAKQDTAFDVWKITTDQSIRGDSGESVSGLELISPKLPFTPYALETLRYVVTAIAVAGYICNDTTGLHVHVSCEDLDNTEVRRVCSFAVAFEHVFDLFVSYQRRDDCNRYARSNLVSVSSSRDWREAVRRIEDVDVSVSLDALIDVMCVKLAPAQNSERNHKLNCTLLRGTSKGDVARRVEFRHRDGTTDPHAVCDWASLCVQFVRNAARHIVSPLQAASNFGDDSEYLPRLPETAFWALIGDPLLEQRFQWYKQQAVNSGPRVFSFESREMFLTNADAYAEQRVL